MYRFNNKTKYDDNMDTECIPLCNALNCLPGVDTISSCCGHGIDPFSIYFKCDSKLSLRFLGRCIDRRYWQYGANWRIELDNSDVNYNYPVFNMRSIGYWGKELRFTVGNDACVQANDFIKNMEIHLNHEAYIKAFIKDLSRFKIINVP